MVLPSRITVKAHSSNTITLSRIVFPATITDHLLKDLTITCPHSMLLLRLSRLRMERMANESHPDTFADLNSRRDKFLHGSSLRLFLGGGPSPADFSATATDAFQDRSQTLPLPVIRFSGIIIPPRQHQRPAF